jgi:myo-inositol catabolism protein IolC
VRNVDFGRNIPLIPKRRQRKTVTNWTGNMIECTTSTSREFEEHFAGSKRIQVPQPNALKCHEFIQIETQETLKAANVNSVF